MTASVGWDIAECLRASWRGSLPPLQISSERLVDIAPLLLSSGAAALVWRRVESLDLPRAQVISDLKNSYLKYMIEAAVHEIEVKDIFERMRLIGIEPILFKGWALARLYPDPGLRPYGDLDLWLPSEQLAAWYAALRSRPHVYCVDTHTSFYRQYQRTLEDVMSRSRLVPLEGVKVRVPCAEDHLRFICLHFLFHGGFRPVWLCDVALMVESRDRDFDWDRCLSGKRKYADWIACVIGLAHGLLGADVTGTPVEKRANELPRWLSPAVLRQWSNGPGMSFTENLAFSFPRRLLRPSALARALKEHWRNPVQATVEMNARFGEMPRGLHQFASVFLRVPSFVRNFGREIRRT